MKKNFEWKPGMIRLGVEIGDHMPDYESFLPFIKNHYDLSKLGFVLFYISPQEVGAERFYEWAKFFADNDICFAFLYTQQRGAPIGRPSHLTPEIVKNIKEIAGGYFIGDMIGETGGLASWPKGYYEDAASMDLPEQNVTDLQQAKDTYIRHVSELVNLDRGMGIDQVLAVEATAFSRYNFEAGVDITCLEMMCGDPEILLASARGATRAYRRKLWGCHIAHEWYGGYRHDDPIKYKRLKLAYDYAYLAGANLIYPESGDYGLRSYGYNYPPDHDYCDAYRKTWDAFADFIARDHRPEAGPLAKVAFVQGNLDSYTGWGGTTVWNQFQDESWGYSDPEYSWNILKNVNRSQKWHDVTVFGQADTSHAPAFGQYDIIPAEMPLEIMSQYDYVIFVGWNTMTPELFEKCKAYVNNGGNLLLTAAHLNTSAKRCGEIELICGGELADFLGCNVKLNGPRLNSGVKFVKESQMPGVLYPATGDFDCDPICAAGFVQYADIQMQGGKVCAFLEDRFMHREEACHPALVENRYGNGCVALLTSLDYPGASGVFPLYSQIVGEWLTASHRTCPIQVLANDRVAFSVYPDKNGHYVVYLLNTDYNVSTEALIRGGEKEIRVVLEPCQLERVETK